jgi:tRNA A37 threonylcarbamoyladenosine biosynthesis protein TsaE
VVVVEWGSRVRELLPGGTINVAITPLGTHDRRVEVAVPSGGVRGPAR